MAKLPTQFTIDEYTDSDMQIQTPAYISSVVIRLVVVATTANTTQDQKTWEFEYNKCMIILFRGILPKNIPKQVIGTARLIRKKFLWERGLANESPTNLARALV